MFWIYNILLTLTIFFWGPFVYFSSFKRKTRPNWGERLGKYSFTGEGVRRVWIHAVSVGEFMAAKPILQELRRTMPEHEIVLSVTTSSGHDAATADSERRKDQGELPLYDRLIYFPLDVARFTLAAMQSVRPEVIGLMESELWWNFLWAAKVFDSEVLILNGRVSDRSYPRAKALKYFYRRMLAEVDEALMQSETDAERITSLGAKSVKVLGSCKFDEAIGTGKSKEEVRSQFHLEPDRPTLVIGSSRGEMEEKFIMEAVQGLSDGLKSRLQVVHAPRHIERADGVLKAAQDAGWQAGLRTAGEGAQYLVLDTYGELAQIYGAADVAIVGGGFDQLGGQNIIQPLAWGVPVVHGRSMQNFRDVSALSAKAGASVSCITPSELTAKLEELFSSPELREKIGKAALELVEASQGASRRYADEMAEAGKRYWDRELKRKRRREEIQRKRQELLDKKVKK